MSKKPELQATAASLEEIDQVLTAGADSVAIGDERFGMRLPGHFAIEDVKAAVKLAHSHGAKLYVAANNLMTNELSDELPDYLREAAGTEADALIFSDPAILTILRESQISIPLIWDGEMLATNYETANFWGKRGVSRVVLSRELSMEEVLEFKRHSKPEVQVQVHGLMNIYHSKRPLLSLYREHQGKWMEGEALGVNRGMYLIEAERQDESFPVYEDRNGTHIMSSEDLCMLENLHELMEAHIDSFKIEGLMKTAAYNETVVRLYRRAIDAYSRDPESWFDPLWLEEIEAIQPPGRPLSYGFYYKEQVY